MQKIDGMPIFPNSKNNSHAMAAHFQFHATNSREWVAEWWKEWDNRNCKLDM